MSHMATVRVVTLMFAVSSLISSGISWIFVRRMRRAVNSLRQLNKETILDAWRGGLEQAAATVAALAEHTWESGSDVATLLYAEKEIHALIHAVKEERAKI